MPVQNHTIPDEPAQEVTAAAEADRVAEPFTLVLFGASGDLTVGSGDGAWDMSWFPSPATSNRT
jgi:hypothetical protein